MRMQIIIYKDMIFVACKKQFPLFYLLKFVFMELTFLFVNRLFYILSY